MYRTYVLGEIYAVKASVLPNPKKALRIVRELASQCCVRTNKTLALKARKIGKKSKSDASKKFCETRRGVGGREMLTLSLPVQVSFPRRGR